MAEQGAGQTGGATKQRRSSGARQFWIAFWLVIIGLAVLYAYAQWTVAQKTKVAVNNRTGEVTVSPEWAEQWQSVVNELSSMTKVEIDGVARERINAKIAESVEAAFAPVYGQ